MPLRSSIIRKSLTYKMSMRNLRKSSETRTSNFRLLVVIVQFNKLDKALLVVSTQPKRATTNTLLNVCKSLKCPTSKQTNSSDKSKFTRNSNILTSSSFTNLSSKMVTYILLWKLSRALTCPNLSEIKAKKVSIFRNPSSGSYSFACFLS